MKIKILLLSSLLFSINLLTTAQVQRIEINTASTPANAEIRLKLVQRFQQYNQKATHTNDKFDTTINSPKSVNILDQSDKFYVHSLEGCRTSVYRLSDLN